MENFLFALQDILRHNLQESKKFDLLFFFEFI